MNSYKFVSKEKGDFLFIKIFLCSVLFTIPFSSSYGYELLSSKTTVSPGCEGGVLEHTTVSYSLVSNDSDSFDENLDILDQ